MGRRRVLGEFEQLVMLAILRLGRDAHGPEIAAELERTIGRSVTRGALYTTLNRLEEKEFLGWEPEDRERVRTGHIRRRFSLTEQGLAALREHRETLRTLWSGVEAQLDGKGS